MAALNPPRAERPVGDIPQNNLLLTECYALKQDLKNLTNYKMKKILLFAAAGLTLASCSQDDIKNSNVGGDALISFELKLPDGYKTRDMGDGQAATALRVLVYDAENDTYELTYKGEGVFNEGGATVNLQLVSGKSYKFVFFATSSTALDEELPVYVLDGPNQTLTVNYANMTSDGNSADAYDCFYNTSSVTDVNAGATPVPVVLTRPVAQINWGANDVADVAETYGMEGEFIESRLTIKAYTTLNFFSGVVSGDEDNVMLPPFTIPTGSYPAGVSDVTYVANQYVLVPASNNNLNMELWISNAGDPDNTTGPYDSVTISVESAPIEANYQTNIYGPLLTDPTDSGIVISKSEWAMGYNPDIHWDGEKSTTPELDGKTYRIKKASDLKGLADMMNRGNTLSGSTITLEDNFDMGGYEFPMMGSFTDYKLFQTGTFFQGILDGQGHTISNINIKGSSSTAGFIACVSGSGAKIQNIIFDNITVNGTSTDQAGAIGYVKSGATVSNVTVKSGSIYSKEGAGGVVGRVSGTGTVTGCTNYADVTVGNQSGGGIAGAGYNTTTGGITISNCTNYGTVTCAGTGQNNQVIGGIVGVSGSNVIGCVNYGSVGNSPASISTVGGIVGIQYSCGSIKNCQNYGEIQGSNYVGGILGWAGGNSYTLKEIIEISGNTNYGTLITNGSAAGIMTINRCTVNLSNNTNDAKLINANNGSAAGIVNGGYAAGNGTPTGGNGYINYLSGNVNLTPSDKIIGRTTNDNYLGTVWIDGAPYKDGAFPTTD